MYNNKMYKYGSNRSAIRDLFEYGKQRKQEIVLYSSKAINLQLIRTGGVIFTAWDNNVSPVLHF